MVLLKPVDPYLSKRRRGGRSTATFSGSPNYAAPEEIQKAFTSQTEYLADEMEHLLKGVANFFVWMEQPAQTLLKLWRNFRSFLHDQNEATASPHLVHYQTALLRFKDCESKLPEVQKVIEQSEDAKEHADLVGAWQKFYKMWLKLAPDMKQYLQRFEASAKEKQAQQFRRT